VTCHRALIARRSRRLRRVPRAAAHPGLGVALAARLGPGGRHQREREPAGQRAPPGPPGGPRLRARGLHLGRPLADRARRDALRAARASIALTLRLAPTRLTGGRRHGTVPRAMPPPR
jgi:hypothetical protein